MTYKLRKLDEDGDMLFGHGQADFHIDTPDGIAQYAKTRLSLIKGEWEPDADQGTDYANKILGHGPDRNTGEKNQEVIRVVENTPGVSSLTNYVQTNDRRNLSVTMNVDTIYGETTLEV